MASMFDSASKVIDMNYMFFGASLFNQPVGNWTTSKAIDMSYMFSRATSFDQCLGAWAGPAKVDDMLFESKCNLSQPLNIDNNSSPWCRECS